MAQAKHDFNASSLRVNTATGGYKVIKSQKDLDAFEKEDAAAKKAADAEAKK